MWWNKSTRSPPAKVLIPPPTAAMVPTVSWPKIRGAECDPVWIFFKSVPQIPQLWTWMRTSPGPMAGTGTVSTRTSFTPRYTAACIFAGIAAPVCAISIIRSPRITDQQTERGSHSVRTFLAIFADAGHGRPVSGPNGYMGQQSRQLQLALGVGVAAKVGQDFVCSVRNRFEAIERNPLAASKPGHDCRFHIHEHGVVG